MSFFFIKPNAFGWAAGQCGVNSNFSLRLQLLLKTCVASLPNSRQGFSATTVITPFISASVPCAVGGAALRPKQTAFQPEWFGPDK